MPLKSETLFPQRFNRNNRRSYIKTDFILVKNNSKMNRIWEYPEEKDIIPLSPNIWKMENNSKKDGVDGFDTNLERNIDQSDLLTHKSKVTEYSKKDSEKSQRRINIEKDKNGSRINDKLMQGYDIQSTDQDLIQTNPSN